jgi:hypothetical protein
MNIKKVFFRKNNQKIELNAFCLRLRFLGKKIMQCRINLFRSFAA